MDGEGTPLVSKHRIEALADGVFAIVVTLLVLELKPPALPRHSSDAEILHALREIAFPLFSFTITFLLAATFWTLHHMTFHYIPRVNRGLLWLNLGFLAFASLLPFSTALLGRFALYRSSTQVIYFGNQLAIATMLWLHWTYSRKKGIQHVEPAEVGYAEELSGRVRMLVVASLSATIVALFAPRASFYAFMFGVLISRAVSRPRRRKLAPPPVPSE